MKLFLDTEFSSLQAAESRLISIALVAEHGREFYADRPPESYQTSCSLFVNEIVSPALWGGCYEMSAAGLTAVLRQWLQGFDIAEIVTDAPDRDFRFLREALDEPHLGWPPDVATGAVYFTPPESDFLFAWAMHPPKLPGAGEGLF